MIIVFQLSLGHCYSLPLTGLPGRHPNKTASLIKWNMVYIVLYGNEKIKYFLTE